MTEAGERYLEDARRILADLSRADEVAEGMSSVPTGSLSITAPVLFGKLHVVPGVVDYLRRYPDTQVSVALLDRVVNLLEEGFDAAIRIGELPDSSMRAARLGVVRTVTCASPDYLQAHGTPMSPEQLHGRRIISIAGRTTNARWRFEHDGEVLTVQFKPRPSVTNSDAAMTAATEGYGFARLFSYQIAQPLSEGRLFVGRRDSRSRLPRRARQYPPPPPIAEHPPFGIQCSGGGNGRWRPPVDTVSSPTSTIARRQVTRS